MRVYNVNVYNIRSYVTNNRNCLKTVTNLDKIMVVKGLFNVQELITKEPINIYKGDLCFKGKNIKYYDNNILCVDKNSLINENIATYEEIKKYITYKYPSSKFFKFLESNNNQFENDTQVGKIK